MRQENRALCRNNSDKNWKTVGGKRNLHTPTCSASSTLFYYKWNPDFSGEPSFFRPPDNSNQKSFPSPQSRTVILPPISRTIRSFEPVFVSLGGSKNRDSTFVQNEFFHDQKTQLAKTKPEQWRIRLSGSLMFKYNKLLNKH